jgi:thioesterase domain-containing protein
MRLGIELSLNRIFDTPTVRHMCKYLHNGVDQSAAVTIPLRQGSSDNTLYLINEWSHFLDLSKALQGRVTTAAVRANGPNWLRQLVGNDDPAAAIVRLSDAYAEAILARHQGGNFSIGGRSFGGVLAIETACRLQERGATPDVVFLFDTALWGDWRRAFDKRFLVRKVMLVLRGEGLAMAKRTASRIYDRFWSLRRIGMNETISEEQLQKKLGRSGTEAYRGPTRPLASSIALFSSVNGYCLEWPEDPCLGWARHFKAALAVIPTPGDHDSLLKQGNAEFVAAEIVRVLKERHRSVHGS